MLSACPRFVLWRTHADSCTHLVVAVLSPTKTRATPQTGFCWVHRFSLARHCTEFSDCHIPLPPPPHPPIPLPPFLCPAGKLLAGSSSDKTRAALDGYLARLTRLGNDDKHVPSRLRFLVSCGRVLLGVFLQGGLWCLTVRVWRGGRWGGVGWWWWRSLGGSTCGVVWYGVAVDLPC